MQCSSKLLIAAFVVAAVPAAMAADRKFPDVGKPLAQNEIQRFDHMIGPEGKELPVGHGTVKEGADIFAKRCEVCHGKTGRNGIVRRLKNKSQRTVEAQRGNAKNQPTRNKLHGHAPTEHAPRNQTAMSGKSPGNK